MSYEIKQSINECRNKLEKLRTVFELATKEKKLEEIEGLLAKENFWDNQEKSKEILKERSSLISKLDKCKNIQGKFEDIETLFELSMEEDDKESLDEVFHQLEIFENEIARYSLTLLLNKEEDPNNAIVSINAGAGGTDAQDWAEILFRMYSRWTERKGFKFELIDLQQGDEAGIKSVTFTAKGEYAFGYLKTEIGVHRLVRISPFNANGKRHTSFASVFVFPELNNDITVEIEEKDLRIDVYRASGAGGQHVNKTSSAVRITHIPTGIIVQCQQEKSQHRNKDTAMKVLKSRIHHAEMQKQQRKMQEIYDNKDEIAWGSQIRSYVLHPYQLVKDHRTNIETGNIISVLDGGIDMIIESVLLSGKC
ncbi:MAG: peptide chain release factor 2 [Desulfobacterales bacterium]|nr:peptide chain release factor 2 [Desulfobacterales bacterium]